MLTRVIVGGSVDGLRLGNALIDKPGRLTLLVEDEQEAVDLREEGLPVVRGDPRSHTAWKELDDTPDVALVPVDALDDPVDICTACRDTYPDVFLLAIGTDVSEGLDTVTDHVIDLTRLEADELLTRLTDRGFIQTLRLLRTLAILDDTVAVVTHDNPDPDAIAAAVGVVALAAAVGTEAAVYFGGEITHQENRAFVNALEIELQQLDDETDLEQFGGIALVDHAHPGVNDRLPTTTDVDIIIDHHPTHEMADATFVDQRQEVGSTSTLIIDHLIRAGIEIDSRLATALWYGLKVDTNNFRRGISPLDFSIAAGICDRVDDGILKRIQSPKVTAETFETFAEAISNRVVRGHVLVTDVGELRDRDALAQAADDLLTMEGIKTVCVFGRMDETIYVSSRTSDDEIDLGDAVRFAFGSIGNAGGHDDMAGAQISVGSMALDNGEDMHSAGEAVTESFFEAIEAARPPIQYGHGEDTQDD